MTVLANHASPYAARTKPAREGLSWHAGALHLLIAEREAAARLAAFHATRGAERAELLPEASLEALRAAMSGAGASQEIVVLAVGPEGFLQRLHALCWQVGLAQEALRTERLGSAAREVYCMACRRTCRGVERRIHRCICGAHLLVRDHFSARLGLYQGAPLPPDDPLVLDLAQLALDS